MVLSRLSKLDLGGFIEFFRRILCEFCGAFLRYFVGCLWIFKGYFKPVSTVFLGYSIGV